MPDYNPNPRANEIIKAAIAARTTAGDSVEGQMPNWSRVSNDPGKSVFWRDGLIQAGMDPNAATKLVNELNRVEPGW